MRVQSLTSIMNGKTYKFISIDKHPINVLKTGPVIEPKKLPVHGSLIGPVVEPWLNR